MDRTSHPTRCDGTSRAPVTASVLHAAAGAAALCIITATLALATPAATAAIVTDRSFFDSVPYTEITWEFRGSGEPVVNDSSMPLINGETYPMPLTEYASQGITFLDQVNWVNDGNGSFDAAQLIGGGSPNLAIPSSNIDFFRIQFDVPIRGFAFFVANNRDEDPDGPTIIARDAMGNIIETITWGAAFIDGSVGQADYGYFGLQTGTLIRTIEISKDAAIFDNFIYSEVPSPAPAFALLLAGAGLGARRNRRDQEPTLTGDGLEAL